MADNITPQEPLIDRAALEQAVGGYEPKGFPEPILPTIPYTSISTPLPQVDGGPTPMSISAIENSVLAARNGDPRQFGGSIPRSVAEVTSSRYDNFVPGDYNNEDAYAQGQGWTAKMVNGVGKGLALTAGTFLQSTLGLANGVARWAQDGRLASFYDNPENRAIDDFYKKLEDILPNYYTDAEKNAAWYSGTKLFSANFLWDGIVKNMGFAAGAALSGNVYAAAVRGLASLPGLSRLVSIGKGAEVLAAQEAGLLSANAASSVGKIKNLSDKFLSSYNFLSPGGRAVVAGLATTGEAGFEAFQNLNQFRNEKIEEYKQANGGLEPMGADLAAINAAADAVGNSSLFMNIGLLTATNYIQFPKILGSSYRAEKGIVNSLTKEIEDVVQDASGNFVKRTAAKEAARGFGGRLFAKARKVAPYTFSASEAFEEGAQYAIGQGVNDYYNKKAKGKNADIIESLSVGIRETLGTDEGMENVLIGGLSGAIMQARGKYKEATEKAKDTADALQAMNSWKFSDFTKATIDSVSRGTAIQEERERYLKQGDILMSKEAERDYIINYLTPRIKYGRFDLVRSDIEDYRRIASTEEGFDQLVKEGKVVEGDTREAYLQRINNLESTANDIKSLYQSLTLRYSNIVGKDGKTLIYTPEVIDKMIYAATKVADYDNRIPSLSSKLVAAGVDIDSVINDVTNDKSDAYDAALAKIEELETTFKINADQKQDLITDLSDVSELVTRRKAMLQEYSDIKQNPEKYQEIVTKQPSLKEKEKGATKGISVETKDGDVEFEIGKEYYAGAPMRKSKEGVWFKDFSRFTILGETEDGKLLIKTVFPDAEEEGETFEVDKDYFKKHQIEDVAAMSKRPNARFYIESAGKTFDYKLGGGEIVRGTIRYNRKTDKLQFVSIDGKKKFTITRGDFAPRKGYKEAKIVPFGKLTAKAIAALNEGITDEELQARIDARDEVVVEAINFTKEKVQKVDEELAKAKEDLTKVNQELEALSLTKEGKPRKAYIGVARKTLNTLLAKHKAIEESISSLEDQREELTNAISYLEETYENREALSDGYKDLVNDLKDDISAMKEMVENTEDAIKTGKGLLDSIKSAIATATSLLDKFISELKAKNPDVPMFLDDLQTRIEKYLGEEGAKQYIADKLGLTEVVAELQDIITSYGEQLNLPDMTNKSEKLIAQIKELEKGFDDLIATQKAKAVALQSFEEAVANYEKKIEQEDRLRKSEKVRKQMLGTQEQGAQTKVFDENYEEDSRKAAKVIPQATKVPSEEFSGAPLADHHVRANEFGANVDSFENRDNIRGVIVTSENEKDILPGLTQFLKDRGVPGTDIDPKETIALVMVEENPETGELTLVGVNGQPIDKTGLSETELLERAIFQVYPAQLKWSNGSSMFRKDTDKEVVDSITEQYEKWRENTLKNPPKGAFQITASFGIPEYVTYTEEVDGEQVQRTDWSASTPVEDAGLVDNEDLTSSPLVVIHNFDTPLELGSTYFEDAIGMPFLQLPNGYVRLKNRKLTEQEAENVYQAIHRLSQIMLDTEDIKNDEAQRLIEYLRSVVYWGAPREGADVGANSVFFEAVPSEGIFEILKLFIKGQEQNISFTPSSIQDNKTIIIAQLEDTYNNVSSRLTDSDWNQPYEEVLSIAEDGTLTTRDWPNYQSYLLSKNLPNEKGELTGDVRPSDELPLSTPMRPLKDADDVNRKGIYFIVDYGEDVFDIPKPKKKKKARLLRPGAPKGEKATVRKKKSQLKPAKRKSVKSKAPEGKTKLAPEGTFVLDGKTVNRYKTKGGSGKPSGKVIYFFATAKDILAKNIKDGIKIIFTDGSGKPFGDAKEVQDDLIEDGKSKEESIKILKDNALFNIKDELAGYRKGKKADKEVEFSDEIVFEEEEEGTEEAPKKGKKSLFQEVEYDDNEEVNEDLKDSDIEGDDTLEDDLDAISDDDDTPYRLQIEEEIKRFEGENWNKVEKWLKANFPNVPVYRVKNLIQATGGRRAWGMFQDGAVYVYENAQVGTIYHEVFHAVFRMFTDPSERQALFNEFRNREGEFFDRDSLKNVKYSEATDRQIEEALAEEFRDYVQYKKIPAKPKGKAGILRVFSDLINIIKEFFLGDKGMSNTEKLFKNIDNGYYKQYSPYHSSLSFAKEGFIEIDDVVASDAALFEVANFTGNEVNDIMQEMTYQTLGDLIQTNKGLFNIPEINKGALYEKLRVDVRRTVTKLYKVADEIIKGKATKEEIREANRMKARSLAMRQSIMNDGIWESLVAKHEQYLRKYNIEFDENDVAIITDENATNKGDWQSADQIDAFRKANSAVKFLLSTLPIVEENESAPGKLDPVPSSIGGVTLLPTAEVFIKLMNNIHDSRNIDDMLTRIKQMAKEDVNYRKLYYRLTRRHYNTEGVDFNNLKDKNDAKLLNALWTSFKKQNPDVKNHYVLENGEVQIGDANFSTAARQAKLEMINGIVKVIKGKNPYFKQDYKENAFVGIPGATRKYTLDSNADRVKFLSSLGITFKVSDLNKLKGRQLAKFKKAVNGIKKSIESAEKISTITGKILDLDGRLLELGEVKAAIENPEFDSTFFGVNGQKKQTYIGPNAASNLYDALSQVESLEDIKTLYPEYSYLLTDSFAEGSVILEKMFNMTSKKKERVYGNDELLKPGTVDGTVDSSNGKNKESSKLTAKERYVQELNLNLAGYYLNLVPGDASLEWLLNMGNHITSKQLLSGFKDVHKIFRKYFISELKLAREDRPVAKKRDSKEMRFFKGILGPELHNKVIKAKGTPENVYDEQFKSEIEAAVENFIKVKSQNTKNVLRTYDVIKLNDQKNWDVEKLDLPNTENVNEADLTRQLNALTINYMINNIELHKLLYSDPYQYSDELKRIKNFNSPSRYLMAGSSKMGALNNRVWNEGFEKDDIGYYDFTKSYFTSTTLADVEGVIDLKGYDSFEETDGSGIITMQAYRAFRINDTNWNDDEERQYRYDIAWEKVDKGLDLSDEEQELYDAGNPMIKSAYTPIKPIVRGNKADGNKYNDVMLDKFALYPLSYRISKTIATSSGKSSINAVKQYEKMRREKTDYVVFNSGRKVGATKVDSVYDKNGAFDESPYKGKINVPLSIVSVQAEVPSKDTNDVTMGSQMTKLVTLDFMEAGIPIDFEKDNDDVNDKYTKWYALTEEQKLEQSELYKEIKNNENILSALIQAGYQELIRELGIKETTKGYRLDNVDKATSLLLDEFLQRDVNDNIISALEGFKDGDVVVEATPAYQQIRNILYSIADKRVVSKKITGGQKVQIPSTFFEDNRMAIKEINGKKGYTSEVLEFYSMEKDGKQINVCEIMVGRWFKSDMSDEALLKYLNDTPEGQKILQGVAFRIPTQKQNSIDVFKIKQFLPYEFGDSVVIPAALVKKVGSDFDIDKLSIYFKNVFIDKFGKPKLIEFLTDDNSTAEERYFHWVVDNSSKDTKKYVKFLSRPVIAKMKGAFANELAILNGKYPSMAKAVKQKAYQGLIDLYKTDLKDRLTDQESYLYELFDKGRDLFFSLSEETREDYWDLKKKMATADIKGPEEIRRYMSLTLAKIENDATDQDDIAILEDMIKLYEEELRVLGITEDFIKEYKTAAIQKFREKKDNLLSALSLETSAEANNIEERYRAEKDAFNFEYAQEVAEKDDLISFEDFKKLNIYEQNTKKALQNAYTQSLENLIRNPLNYSNLIKPNSSDDLKKLANEIVDKLNLTKFDYASPENMLDRNFMSQLRHSFVTGKYAIGIAAVNQTNHSLNQRQLIYIDPEMVSDEDKDWLGDGRLKFVTDKGEDNFNTVSIGGRKLTSLSGIFTKAGDYISDILGMFIDGYVDISKGPWIMQLGATPNVASTYMFLVKAGVPVKSAVYFMNQPIVRDYLRSLENAGYTWIFNKNFVDDIKDLYKYKASNNLISKITSLPSETEMENMLGVEDLTPMQKAQQQYILGEFLKYSKMAQQLFYVTQGSNFDTANFNDGYLVYKKEQALSKAKKTIIRSLDEKNESIPAVEAIIDNSFLKSLRNYIGKMRNALSTILMSDRKRVRAIVQNVLYNHIDKSDRDFVKVAQKTVNDLFDWAVQTDESLRKKIRYNVLIEKALLGEDNYVEQINDFLEGIRNNKKHPLYNNLIVKSLKPIVSNKFGQNNVSNLKLDNKDNKTFDQNLVISAFEELKNYLKGSSTLYNKIKAVAVIQSGISNSPISFTNLLPYEDFKDIYNEILSNLEIMPNLELFNTLNVFERNNWSDDDVVPRKRAKLILASNDEYYDPSMDFLPNNVKKAIKNEVIPQVISISTLSREGEHDIIVYQWEDRSIPYYERIKMKKRGDYSYIKKGLFKKVKDEYGEDYVYSSESKGRTYNNFIYQAINAWGDGYKANEFYNTPTQSKIENGFIKVDEVANSKVLAVFEGTGGFSGRDKKKISSTSKKMRLKDGNEYPISDINAELLEIMGYKPFQIGKILKSIC